MEELRGKTLVVIGGGLLQVPVIRRAKESGIVTVVLDQNREAPGVKIADYFVMASTLDAEAALYNIEKFNTETRKIDAVLTVGTDASFTVATIAKQFGLPGIEPEAALAASDKFEMRKALRKAKVPVPDFDMVDTYPKALELFERLGGDVVVKPVRNMGARGVRRVTAVNELKESYDNAMHNSPSGKVIVEQYIDAAELSIDSLVYRGEIFITGVADRIIEYDPYFVETGHIMPTRMPDDIIQYALDTFRAGVRALGITHGAAKGDIKVSNNGCFIGEIAARLSGGFMSTHTYPYSTGVDLMANMIRVAFGLPPAGLEPRFRHFAIERSIIAPPGIIHSVEGLEEAAKMPFVKDIFFDGKKGQKVKSPTNNVEKIGHLIVAAPTYREALEASHRAVRAIRVATVEDDDQVIPDDVLQMRALSRFDGKCHVCADCDGRRCKGQLPGVGGIGTGNGFIRAVERIRQIDIIPSYINDAKRVDTGIDFLGQRMEYPFMPAPITGAITNLGGAVTELELARAIVKGANQAGIVGCVGDGATPTKFRVGIRVIHENFGFAIPVFKPRYDNKLIMERFDAARDAGAIAVAVDIDAASFLTMELKGQATATKNFDEVRELAVAAQVPFLLKGILSARDAEAAFRAGVSGVIVSNHGGRVNDSSVSPVDALRPIRKAVGPDKLVIYDGGVRSGGDVLKAIAFGADLVMIGRPVMVAAVGGGIQGVRQYFNRIGSELKRAMTFAGVRNIAEAKGNESLLFIRL
jgi:isopentenyl diphosphate isomerase/L-lactate dehydrogenase-like FMN-dependent dehydrogenase/biotin carboxylase